MARQSRRELHAKILAFRTNPYIDWAWGIGKRHYFLPGKQVPGQERMPLILRVRGISAKNFVAGAFIRSVRRRRLWRQGSFQVLLAAPEPVATAKVDSWIATMATKEISDIVTSREARRHVQSIMLGRPLDTQALPPFKAKPKQQAIVQKVMAGSGSTPHKTVVMACIDDGIAFANERFRIFGGMNDGTRVEWWWLQDGPFGVGSSPPLPFGHHLKRADINPLLSACTIGGVLHEDLFYRRARLTDYLESEHKSASWRASHGTHVMDLACGFNPKDKNNDRPIICVQLPTRVTASAEPGDLHTYGAWAMWYILNQALTIAADRGINPLVNPLPVVINWSYGLHTGPHDGTGDIEVMIEDWIKASIFYGVPFHVVLPAGNSYLSRTHASFSFAGTNTQRLRWRILPDDRTPSFLEIWLPPPASPTLTSRVKVTITSPAGLSWQIKEYDPQVDFGTPIYGNVKYMVSGADRRAFVVRLSQTADDPPTALAPTGTWQIDVRRTGALADSDVLHAWIWRDDSLYGFPLRGRQSYLDDPHYVRHDHSGRDKETDDPLSLVKRESTINSIATGDTVQSPIVLGAHLRKELVPAKYSAEGAKIPPPRGPDAMVASEDSRVHRGVMAAGTISGSRVTMGGTSVAAPQIARWVADDLAGGGTGDRTAVQILAAAVDPPSPPPPPFSRGGFGRIELVPMNPERYWK